MFFQDFDIETFLRDHWQKTPLLIRNPFADWRNPLEPDELAGLACEEDIEARLIVQGKKAWNVEHGPIPEARFGTLGKSPWTLLVQAVDQHVPDVAALIDPFRFLPDWRIDDVMVSYASDGGGVGPHFDQYDVFLIQGLGRRRWQVGARCDADTALLLHEDLRLLADFQPVQEWVLEPGDILYLPPRFAHDGVAVGDDCMTYSVGFRAPSRSELVTGWSEAVVEELIEDDRYTDPESAGSDARGEISPAAIARLHALVMERIGDRAAFARWFAAYVSAPKYPDVDFTPDETMGLDEAQALVRAGTALRRNPASRLSFVRGEAGTIWLYADGVDFDCTGDVAGLAEQLCASSEIEIAPELAGSDAAMALVVALVNQGSIGFDAED